MLQMIQLSEEGFHLPQIESADSTVNEHWEVYNWIVQEK